MKIAIDGAQSTGKTELWTRLRTLEFLNHFHFIPESSSIVANTMGIRSANQWDVLIHDRLQYRKYVDELFSLQIRQEKTMPFISDSSLFRICAYAIENELHSYKTQMSDISYDLIFYCPVEFEIVDDGFRTNHFRHEINYRLLSIIREYNKGKIVLLSGSIQERMEQIVTHLTHFF